MRIILLILLFLVFGYSLALVLANNSEVGVNLLFSQAPAMNLGLLLIVCMALGVLIGLLLSLLLFRVFQNKWEISRLQKENKNLQEKLKQANIAIDRQANAPTINDLSSPNATPSHAATGVRSENTTAGKNTF